MGSNKVTDRNRLSLNNKKIALELSYKNKFTSDCVAVNSRKMAIWECSTCKFEWTCSIVNRNLHVSKSKKRRTSIHKFPSFCPNCASKLTSNTLLMNEWNYEKNVIHPCWAINTGKYWWKCSKCNSEWETWLSGRLKGYGGCWQCKSLAVNFPELTKEFSPKNGLGASEVSYGTNKKYLWECLKCKNEWRASVSSRTAGGNGCPVCIGVKLKDGTLCASLTEAYFYLKFKSEGKPFLHNNLYNDLGNSRYDFYFPDEDKYVEVTSFHRLSKTRKGHFNYLRNIAKKKKYVESIGSKFEFIQYKLSSRQRMHLRDEIF